jgi:endonuclease/exonuclease/phosphatase family metal-dependent hydrolase
MSKRYIHIGSWNIEHFSKRGGREENIYALTEHIEMASLDVIALQEIYVTHVDDDIRRNEHLDGVVELLLEHTECQWQYEIFENRKADDMEQLCAVAWNATTISKLATYKIPVETQLGGKSLWDRTPHAVKFKYREKTDFVVVPLHMKSNYGGATEAKRIRHLEAQTLMANIPRVKEELEDLDIILIGDTNCLGSTEQALQVITGNGFEDLNEADAGTFVSGAPFDRVFLSQERRAFDYSRQYIMVSANPDDHDKYLSDHYLIKTVIKIRRDDD